MRIRLDPTPVKESRASGHLLRFGIGGSVTVCAALVAKVGGPKIGGLGLALPAILPIGIALMAKLQNEKVGPDARGDRARRAATIEAAGASAGGLGMVAFALVAWRLLVSWPSGLSLAVATVAWTAIALIAWFARKTWRRK